MLGLAAGCRSTQSVYRVTPAPGTSTAQAVPDAPATPEPNALPTPAKPLNRSYRTTAAANQRPAASKATPLLARTIETVKSSPTLVRAAKRVVRRAPLAPHNTAEVGLGTTFLGILGILAIPIGLIGLLLSGGGLAWAIVAIVGGLLLLNAIYEPFVD